MTNPHLYIPTSVPQGAGASGPTIRIEDAATLVGFHLRLKAAEHLRDVSTARKRSSMARTLDAVRAQALTDYADEIDPAHRADSEALYAQ